LCLRTRIRSPFFEGRPHRLFLGTAQRQVGAAFAAEKAPSALIFLYREGEARGSPRVSAPAAKRGRMSSAQRR